MAADAVIERMRRTASVLEAAGVPYAVIGGNAVGEWVGRQDESAVRNTRDVDILIQRSDLPAATAAMEAAGFIYRHVRGIDMFLDGPGTKARDAVHLIFADEKVRPDSLVPSPGVADSERARDYRVVSLEALVLMKLTSFRPKDQMHLIDLRDVELIDGTWAAKYPAELGERLLACLNDPNNASLG